MQASRVLIVCVIWISGLQYRKTTMLCLVTRFYGGLPSRQRSHIPLNGKREIIFNITLGRDMFVPRRVLQKSSTTIYHAAHVHIPYMDPLGMLCLTAPVVGGFLKKYHHLWYIWIQVHFGRIPPSKPIYTVFIIYHSMRGWTQPVQRFNRLAKGSCGEKYAYTFFVWKTTPRLDEWNSYFPQHAGILEWI